MGNFTADMFENKIDKVKEMPPTTKTDTKSVVVQFEKLNWFIEDMPIKIKVGDNKVEVSMVDFIKAFKDMLDTGEFYMDQIDESVWEIEKKLEDLSDQNGYLNDTLSEIRGL